MEELKISIQATNATPLAMKLISDFFKEIDKDKEVSNCCNETTNEEMGYRCPRCGEGCK